MIACGVIGEVIAVIGEVIAVIGDPDFETFVPYASACVA